MPSFRDVESYMRRLDRHSDEMLSRLEGGEFSASEADRIAYLEDHIAQESSSAPTSTRYQLEDQWVQVGFRRGSGEESSIQLSRPIETAQYSVLPWNFRGVDFDYEDRPQLLERYRQSLTVHAPASLTIESERFVIQPGQHRPSEVTEERIAYGFNLFSTWQSEWKGANLEASFYSCYVAPHLAERGVSQSPIDWVADRLKIIGGTVLHFAGYDYPLAAVEEPLRDLSNLVVNLHPQRLREPMVFARSPGADRALALLGENPAPELAYLFLSLEPDAAQQLWQSEVFQQFSRDIEQYLSRGLLPDRIVELARSLSPDGIDAAAMEHAVIIAKSLFNQPLSERAWWFHEDRAIAPEFRSSSWGNPENREQHKALAAQLGAVYQYAQEVWERKGRELVSSEGIPLSKAIDFVGQVTTEYGMGNVERACNVMDFALAALNESSGEDRVRTLQKLSDLLSEKRPPSIVFGLLEGRDANFDKPGIFTLIDNLVGHGPGKEVCNLTLSPADLVDAVRLASQPLQERAKIRPKFLVQPNHPQLITDLSESGILKLPIPEQFKLMGKTETPINSWINFDRLVASEVPEPSRRAGIATMYLGLYATRMPEPFNPPAGFISFLNRFKSIPDPNWRFAALEHPDDRELTHHQNATRKLDRQLIVAGVVDTALLGLVSWEEAVDILEWMVVEGPGRKDYVERARLEQDHIWEAYWNKRDYEYDAELNLADYDNELKCKAAELEEERFSLLEKNYHSPDPWRNRQLERIEAEIENIKASRMDLPAAWLRYVSGGYEDERDTRNPEEIERYAEERRSQDLRNAVESGINRLANERIEKLGRVQGVLKIAHGLIVAGVADAELMAPLITKLIRGVRSAQIEIPDSIGEVSWELSDLVPHLKAMNEIGLLKVPEKIGRLKLDPVGEGTLDLLLLTIKLIDAYGNALNSIEASGRPFLYNRQSTQEVIESARKLELKIAQAFEPVASELVENAVPLMLEEYCTELRYRLIAPQVIELVNAESERRTGTDQVSTRNQAVESSIDLAIGMWAFADATHQYRTRGGAAFILDADERRLSVDMNNLASAGQLVPMSSLNQVVGFNDRLQSFRELVKAHRASDFGKLPLGGKVHVLHQIDHRRLASLMSCFGLGGTSFKLENASRSLILPPMPSALEIRAIANFLSLEKIIDSEYPEIQMCLPGRLSADDCAILGASVILGSESLVQYSQQSFSTTHNFQTGYRMMMYDDGGFRGSFPFDVANAGRTDMQGRKRISDFVLYQTLGSVLIYAAESPEHHQSLRGEELHAFREVRDWYVSNFRELLASHSGLEEVLSVRWVHARSDYRTEGLKEEGERFYRGAIVPLTEAYQKSLELLDSNGDVTGILAEMENLATQLTNKVRNIQEIMLDHPHYESHRQQLFNV